MVFGTHHNTEQVCAVVGRRLRNQEGVGVPHPDTHPPKYDFVSKTLAQEKSNLNKRPLTRPTQTPPSPSLVKQLNIRGLVGLHSILCIVVPDGPMARQLADVTYKLDTPNNNFCALHCSLYELLL